MEPLNFKPSAMNWSDWMRQNEIVRNWTIRVRKLLKASAKRFTKGKKKAPISYGTPPHTEYKLATDLRHRVFYKFGISEGTSFRFQRHGVFRHYGTGRGYKRIGGMVVRVKKSANNNNKTASYEQVNAPHRRSPADWFNPIIDANAPQLANQVAEVNANAALNAFRMRIK